MRPEELKSFEALSINSDYALMMFCVSVHRI